MKYIHDTKYLAGALGAFSAIVFSHILLWPLAILAFAGLLVLLKKSVHAREGFVIGTWFGFFYTGGVLLWIFSVFPLTGLGIDSYTLSALLLLLIWTTTTALLTLALSAFGYLVVYLRSKAWVDILLVPSLWVLMEIVRALLFSLLNMAPQSLWGAHWTFGYSGYILAGSPVALQFASFGGVYLLGFIFALLGVLLVYYYDRCESKRLVLLIFIVIVLLLYIPVRSTVNTSTMRITALKTMESSYFSSDDINRNERLLRIKRLITAAPKDTQMIILPEDTRFLKLYSKKLLGELTIAPSTFILDSSRFDTSDKPALSRIMTYSKISGIQNQYTKLLLVPNGEYLATFYQSILALAGMQKEIDSFNDVEEYARGTQITTTHMGSLQAAVSLCSEIYSPFIQRKLSARAGVMIVLSSQSLFHGNRPLYTQIVAMSKVRAVENNRYLIQAFNFGNAFVISNTGEVVATTKKDISFDTVTYDVPLIYQRTLFSRYPFTVPLISLLFVLYFFAYKRIYTKKKTE